MPIHHRLKHWTHQLLAPEAALKRRYAAFRALLSHDKRAHELMAALEEIFYQRQKRDFAAVQRLCAEMSRAVAAMVDELAQVCPGQYEDLNFFFQKIDHYIRYMSDPIKGSAAPPYAVALGDIGPEDLLRVGGKALNLGIVRNVLGMPVPEGFVISTAAQHLFFETSGLRERIDRRLAEIDGEDAASLDAAGAQIGQWIREAELPEAVHTALSGAYTALSQSGGKAPQVAMRSSAVGEDGQASFAGLYRSFLNVHHTELAKVYKEIIAGKYAPEALAYRIRYGLSDAETPMAVLVLEMVAAASSGVIYTASIGGADTTGDAATFGDATDGEENARDQMRIHSVWGLGELLVSGQTPADIFSVAKAPPHAVIASHAATKRERMVAAQEGGTGTESLPSAKGEAYSLTEDQVARLARRAARLDAHYGQAQDIEWAVDSEGSAFILQSRPLGGTGTTNLREKPVCTFEELPTKRLLQDGVCAAGGIAAGTVFSTASGSDLTAVPRQAVLVAAAALPQYAKVMDRLSAVVTETGSPAGHLATVAREFGVPMVVNASGAVDRLSHGATLTVHADDTAVYKGRVAEMLASPCAAAAPLLDTPFMRKLAYILSFVASLDLVDPQSKTFTPRHCRSFHDIIRFAHEKAVQKMFHISDKRLRKPGFAKKLTTRIPMLFYILDVGGGLADEAAAAQEIGIETVRNRAMRALWEGLGHPDIQWGSFSHFDWEAHDRMVMSGGIASPDSAMFASHAVISDDYMNLNLRFGYHFVIVDALCAPEDEESSILMRFSGGGADMDQRLLRTEFLGRILRRLGFAVTTTSDLIDAEFKGRAADTFFSRLDMLGRLLGATRLMDMYLKDPGQIDGFVADFMQGRYHFASVEME